MKLEDEVRMLFCLPTYTLLMDFLKKKIKLTLSVRKHYMDQQ